MKELTENATFEKARRRALVGAISTIIAGFAYAVIVMVLFILPRKKN